MSTLTGSGPAKMLAALVLISAGCGSKSGGQTTPDGSTGGPDGADMMDTGGGGPSDIPVDVMRGSCGAILCDDFEDGTTVNPDRWTVEIRNAGQDTLDVQTDKVAHGTNALHTHVRDMGGLAMLHETSTFPATADDIWARAMFFTTLDPTAGHTAFSLAYVGSKVVFELGYTTDHWQVTFFDSAGEHPQGGGTVPLNRWACVEWHFSRVSGPFIEVFVDGTLETMYITPSPLPNVGTFTEMTLGISTPGTHPPGNDVYWDDVAIDNVRVGCP